MIVIDYKDTRPLYEQVAEKMKTLILRGAISPGEQLPSVRAMAMELAINPNTIQRSFNELEREGYIYAIKGRGNFVSDTCELLDDRRRILMTEIQDKAKEALEYGVDISEIISAIEEIRK